MTILHRLSKLERKKPAPTADCDSRAKLLPYLSNIGGRLRASGIVDHRPDRSPAERLAMAFERGDADTAKAMLSAAVGREVAA